jgi:hypothetical protein
MLAAGVMKNTGPAIATEPRPYSRVKKRSSSLRAIEAAKRLDSANKGNPLASTISI